MRHFIVIDHQGWINHLSTGAVFFIPEIGSKNDGGLKIWRGYMGISSITSDDPKGLKMEWFHMLWGTLRDIYFTVKPPKNNGRTSLGKHNRKKRSTVRKTIGKNSTPSGKSSKKTPSQKKKQTSLNPQEIMGKGHGFCEKNLGKSWKIPQQVLAHGEALRMRVVRDELVESWWLGTLHGKMEVSVGKPWENHGKTMGIYENIVGKLWENCGKIGEHHLRVWHFYHG